MGDDAARALQYQRKRQLEHEEAALRRKKIEHETKFDSIDGKFSAKYDAIEERIRTETVGLLTLEQMKAKREKAMREHDLELALTHEKRAERRKQQEQASSSDSEAPIKKKTIDKSKLSFAFDGDDDDDDDEDNDKSSEPVTSPSTIAACDVSQDKSNQSSDLNEGADGGADKPTSYEQKKKRLGMCPDVDTSFLPDRERDEEEAKIRQQLASEWRQAQERIKNEEVEITYSYWDGSGHRRAVTIRKGFSIQQFLQKALEALRAEFNELRVVGVDQLMFIKEDLIIPHHYTFYEFIVTKARGKSGPLFDFTVRNDIRLVNDASIEKEESHAGKVCLRSWYERNKHIFPASRWEPYDPEKKWDKYTVKDPKNKASTALTAPNGGLPYDA